MVRVLLLLVIVSVSIVSCITIDSGLPEPIFTMPDGSPEAGRAAFQKFACYSCHEVDGEQFPKPVADPPVPVRFQRTTDGELPPVYFTAAQLAESIINPSHRISPWLKDVKSGSGSRMGDFTEVMTVRELIDLVAFLQTKQR